MIITTTQLKMNTGHYLSLVGKEEIIITRNGKTVAKLVPEKEDLNAAAKSLFGILPNTSDIEEAKEERLKRYENID